MRLLMLCALLCVHVCASANNIRVKKLSLTDTVRSSQTVKIKFDLSWENSWRDDINWDAAWVFAKVKGANGNWRHIKLSLTGSSIDSSSNNAKIVVPTDKMGAYVYRSGNGTGTISMQGVRLTWNYGQDSVNIDSAEIRVFATEMVYVPRGSFAFGNRYTGTLYAGGIGRILVPEAFRTFKNQDTAIYGSDVPVFSLISEKVSGRLVEHDPTNFSSGDNPIVNGFFISGTKGVSNTDTSTFTHPNFPTGFNAFYCMKYEVTQGQYADFLNTLSITESDVNSSGYVFPYSNLGWVYPKPTSAPRYSIAFQNSSFSVSRPDRAMKHVSEDQAFLFAIWSGLRPMTELEFEKACRGPEAPRNLVPYYERAHGNYSSAIEGFTYSSAFGPRLNGDIQTKLSGPENGTETVINMDSSLILQAAGNIIGGDDNGGGIYRVGLFATSNSTRKSSGSSYYGISGLTDNASEIVISVSLTMGKSYSDMNGDGKVIVGENPAKRWLGNFVNNNGHTVWLEKSSSVSDRLSILPASYNSQSNPGFRLVRTALPAENQ
jgi:formylglycine-generating enzyme required for sulfatase activity